VAHGTWTPENGVLKVVELSENKHVAVLHHKVGLESALIELERFSARGMGLGIGAALGQYCAMSLRPFVLLGSVLLCVTSALAANWPAWRGPTGDGISPEKDLPLTWSATENVQWKVELPEPGNSSPIVWGSRVFLAQAVGDRRTVTCFNRSNGQQLWQEGPVATFKERSHPTNPYCSASPVTDGERVVAWFGSAGLWCWDLEGKEQWHLDLGKHDHEWGYGGSPVILGDLCFLVFGPGERSFLLAVDKKTGEKRWQVDFHPTQPASRTDGFAGKDGVIGSWATPIVIQNPAGQSELIINWPEKLVAYDPASGRELWSCGGLNPLIYTSPVAGEGMVFASGGYGGSSIVVKTGGKGDVSESRLWQKLRDKQRIGSGVIKDGHLYIFNVPGTAQCIELATGKSVWEERLTGSGARGESWSSMVLSGERLYVLNQSSDTLVLEAAPVFKKLATNVLGDGLGNASLAASDGQFFIRTHKHLWCVGK
jgi:outer membrane protein assembly factor BamB